MTDSIKPVQDKLTLPLNSRQKIILQFLLKQKAEVKHTALMKWLFLFSRRQPLSVSSYNFVPYKYGPYSFEAQQDLNQSLARYVEDVNGGFRLRRDVENEVTTITDKIKATDLLCANEVWSTFAKLAHQDLLDRVYAAYPWYASRSELVAHIPQDDADIAVYTSGYEGKSIDAFFATLLQHGIRGVLDVRRTAYSHKYGFSGATLQRLCSKLAITYDHLQELGVASELRKDLSGAEAFAKLFDEYELKLPEQSHALRIAGEIVRLRPTTLMCFEAMSECCHRGRLAPKIASQVKLPVKHL